MSTVTVTVPADLPDSFTSKRIRSAFCSIGIRLIEEQKNPPHARACPEPKNRGRGWRNRVKAAARTVRTST